MNTTMGGVVKTPPFILKVLGSYLGQKWSVFLFTKKKLILLYPHLSVTFNFSTKLLYKNYWMGFILFWLGFSLS